MDRLEGLDATDVLEHEHDYDGRPVFRGFGSAVGLSACFWVAVIAGCAQINRNPVDTTVAAELQSGGPKGDCGNVPMPPAKYDHEPSIHYIILRYPWPKARHICEEVTATNPNLLAGLSEQHHVSVAAWAPESLMVQACSEVDGDAHPFGSIVIPDDQPADWTACVLRHEKAHLNGWSSWHPEAHYETGSASL